MADSDNDAPCPECGEMCVKVLARFALGAVKGTSESPGETAKRLSGKRKHFDNPWPDKETGKCERVYLTGSKANQKAQVRESVMRTKYAERHKIKESDISATNV